MIVELGEDAYIPVSHSNHVLLGVKDSIVKDFLREEGCIVALFLGPEGPYTDTSLYSAFPREKSL